MGTTVLAYTTWALVQEWAPSIQTAKTVTWKLTPGVGACPKHYDKPN